MLGLLSTNDVQNGEQDHTHRNAEKHANYHRQHDTYMSHTHTHTHTPVTRDQHYTHYRIYITRQNKEPIFVRASFYCLTESGEFFHVH